jgi:hypothetical protein
VTSDELENVFNRMLHLDYPRDVFPTYAAYSFGEDDILTSMLSTSRDKLQQFVRENLEAQKGVVSVEVARINMSKRVAPTEMWRKYRESKYIFKPAGEYEEYDFTELYQFVTNPGEANPSIRSQPTEVAVKST